MKKTIASIIAAAYLTTAVGFCEQPKLKDSLEQKTTDYIMPTKPTVWNHLNPLYTYKNKSRKTNMYIKIGKISSYILLGYILSKKEEKKEDTESKDGKDNNQDKGRILSFSVCILKK
jgi:hypothetical protein